MARIDAASCALRDFIQFKDQQIKNGVIGINNNSHLLSRPAAGISSLASSLNNLNNNNYDFTSDEHIDNTTGSGILISSNVINNSSNIDNTISNQLNQNQTNHRTTPTTTTLEDENLVKKIQQSLECLKSKTENQNIAWVNRLQSKYNFHLKPSLPYVPFSNPLYISTYF